jgi:hypothetical protein
MQLHLAHIPCPNHHRDLALRTLHVLCRRVVGVVLRFVSLRMIAARHHGWSSGSLLKQWEEGLGPVILDVLELPQQLLELDSVLLR